MAEYRAPRVWHIEERFDRFYVVNQFGGFESYYAYRSDAEAAGRNYVAAFGDRFED